MACAARAPLGEVLARPEESADLLSAAAISLLRSGEAHRRAEVERAHAKALGLQIVALSDADYPALLREIYDPPAVLYVRGRLSPEEGNKAVTIVGSRAASPRGSALARGMARISPRPAWTIVSGLARGIDTRGPPRAPWTRGVATVAVLGSRPRPHLPAGERGPGRRDRARRGRRRLGVPAGNRPRPAQLSRGGTGSSRAGRAVVVVEAAGAQRRPRHGPPGPRRRPRCPGCAGSPHRPGSRGRTS